MADIINPHDRFFRYVFANTEWTRQLLATALPRRLLRSMDLDTLQVESGSFIDEELREHFSDMLFNAQLVTGQVGYAYMLFEHKSYPDKVVPFQMLRYIVRIWEQVMRDQKNGLLPPVVCLVFYHGRQKWNIPLHLGGLVDAPAEWRTYVPEFRYVLIDLSVYDAAQIKEPILMQAALLVMKHIFDPDLEQQLPDVLALFSQLQKDQTVIEFLVTILRYIMSANPYVNRASLVRSAEMALPQIGGDIVTTIAQELIEQGIKQGIERGIEQGRELGVRQELIHTIHAGLELKFSEDGLVLAQKIIRIQDIPTLRTLLTEVIRCATVEQFRAAYQKLNVSELNSPNQDDSVTSDTANQPE